MIVQEKRHDTALNAFFPHKVCINLDRRPERWQRMQARLAQHRLGPVTRFSAFDGRTLEIPPTWTGRSGAFGCMQSHLAVVRQARHDRLENVLIMEDDVLFDEEIHAKFEKYKANIPSDWDMLFFGCIHSVDPVPVSEGIARLRCSFSTYMYALKHTIYDAFIDVNEQAVQAVDDNNTLLQKQFNCYCFMPHLAWVDDSFSDAQGLHVNHWYLKESVVFAGERMKAIERETVMIIPFQDRTKDGQGLRNLQYILKEHGDIFTVLIVEQDDTPRLNPADLPKSCRYIFIKKAGRLDKGLCFNEGLKLFENDHNFFVFSDQNILHYRSEIRANLLKCLDHDFASSAAHFIDLNEADSRALLAGQEIGTQGYRPRRRANLCSGYCTFTRAGIKAVGGWEEAAPERVEALQAQKVQHTLKVFESPGLVFRLFAGTP